MQLVNGVTRKDHRVIMNVMIQLYAEAREAKEKQAMGFRMNAWDRKLLAYAGFFEAELMDLAVNLPLETALDRGWSILARCFERGETAIPTALVEEFWPA